MARRSPMNNRYQKGTEPKGVARKSAARAKPKRAAGEQNSSASSSGRAANKKSTATAKKGSSFLREMPSTPEYKQQRKIWWYCLGASFTLLLVSLALGVEQVYSFIGLGAEQASTVGLTLTWTAMLLVGAAWYLDFKKIRPLVRAFEAEKAGKKNKASKDDKDQQDKAKDEGKSKKDDAAKDKTKDQDKSKEDISDKKSKSKGTSAKKKSDGKSKLITKH